MRRHLALLLYALGALRRRAGRHIALTLGLALVIGAYASVLWFTGALRHEWRASLRHTPDLVVQRLEAGRPALLDASAPLVEEGFGVRSVRPRVWGYLFIEAVAANATVVASESPATLLATDAITPAMLMEPPDAPEDGPPQAFLGAGLAERLAVRAGDRFAIPDARGEIVVLRVAGVFRRDRSLHSLDVLLTDEATGRKLLDVPAPRATDVAIELARPEEASAVIARVRQAMPTARILEKRALTRTYELTFDGRGGLLGALFVPALLALLLIGWERLTGMSSAERREIAVLKAIGWETRDVLVARLWESAVIALGGAALGLVGGYVYVFVAGAPGLSGALLGWSALSPEWTLRPTFEMAWLGSLLGLVIAPFLAVSIVPAWRAAITDPSRALR